MFLYFKMLMGFFYYNPLFVAYAKAMFKIIKCEESMQTKSWP